MSAEVLSFIAGGILSILFSYVPGFNNWYKNLGNKTGEGKTGDFQRLIMLAALVLSAVGVYGLSCTSWGTGFGLELSCGQSGATLVILSFFRALFANQTVYQISLKLGMGKVGPSDRTKGLG